MSRFFRLIVIQLLLMALTTTGFAQLRRLGFFINGAGFFPTQKNINLGYGSGIGGVIYLNPNISVSETFSLYVFAGGGYFFNSFRLKDLTDWEEVNVRRQEIDSGLGFYGGIGSNIKLSDKLSLFFEGLYLRRTADAETIYLDNSPSTTFRVNLSSFSVLIGLDYFY